MGWNVNLDLAVEGVVEKLDKRAGFAKPSGCLDYPDRQGTTFTIDLSDLSRRDLASSASPLSERKCGARPVTIRALRRGWASPYLSSAPSIACPICSRLAMPSI